MSETGAIGGEVILGENLDVLGATPDGALDLIYVDPPFNTGETQTLARIRTRRSDEGDRIGFAGRRYHTEAAGTISYDDAHVDYLAFLEPRLSEFRRVLSIAGTLYIHLDSREVHRVKLLLDRIFGQRCFLNEIIWAYDYGARSRRRWPAKHDNILVYVRHPSKYYFDVEAVERIPYMAPGLVGPEKAARGKLPTDVWWHTIVPTNGRERTGYPTQKPVGIARRIVQASSPPGGLVADFFAGSGTVGAACLELGRRFLLVDSSPAAAAVMARRFAGSPGVRHLVDVSDLSLLNGERGLSQPD